MKKKIHTWNIRLLVDKSFVPASQQTSEPAYFVVDCRILNNLLLCCFFTVRKTCVSGGPPVFHSPIFLRFSICGIELDHLYLIAQPSILEKNTLPLNCVFLSSEQQLAHVIERLSKAFKMATRQALKNTMYTQSPHNANANLCGIQLMYPLVGEFCVS